MRTTHSLASGRRVIRELASPWSTEREIVFGCLYNLHSAPALPISIFVSLYRALCFWLYTPDGSISSGKEYWTVSDVLAGGRYHSFLAATSWEKGQSFLFYWKLCQTIGKITKIPSAENLECTLFRRFLFCLQYSDSWAFTALYVKRLPEPDGIRPVLILGWLLNPVNHIFLQLEGGGVASGGLRELIPCVARTCVAVGVDGIFMEVRPDSHGNCSLVPTDA